MPPIVVKEIFDAETAVEDTVDRGVVGLRKFQVGTGDPFAARLAPGIPRKWNAHSTAYPGLLATNIRSVRWGGVDDASGVNAWSIVTVQYTEPGTQWGGTVKEVQPPGVKHTVFGGGTEQVEIYGPVDDDGELLLDYSPVFNNGKPVNKTVGRTSVEVYDFRATNFDYGSIMEMALDYKSDPALNSDTISLPPPLGLSIGKTLPAKRALYVDFRVEVRPEAILLVHTLEIRTNGFNVIWGVLGDDLSIIAIAGTGPGGQIYRAQPFGGLWS